ncbi:hypothetical protein [Streptomyces sp. NRRL S-1448]|uniref:hypothetical protein n=1 Tax=Streptomyces sp. NRRL S-1448 TaxID=1463883 RepID=UPI0004BFF1E2|nr:hypothetical protein [Streptomyces sp. NRRL S-1448]
MDSGVAAIVGAVVGAAGTGLAASVTGFWAARTAKLQVAAQESQGKRQLAFEKAKEWRVERKAAYASFAEKMQNLGREVDYVGSGWRVTASGPQDGFLELSRSARAVESAAFEVLMEGSAETAEAAREISELARSFQRASIALRVVFLVPVKSEEDDERLREHWRQMCADYEQAMDRFFKAAWTDLSGTTE